MGSSPLLTTDFLNYFKTLNLKSKILLEIGSGSSTLYWSSYFKKIYSYENDIKVYRQCIATCPDNVSFFHYNKNIFNTPRGFINHIKEADYIIIDNNPRYIDRFDFAQFGKEYKKPSSSIVLDNGNWNQGAYRYLFKYFYCRDFPGLSYEPGALYNKSTVTTLFFKAR